MSRLLSYDDIAWQVSEDRAQSWLDNLHDTNRYVAIKDFILEHRGGIPIRFKPVVGGSNISFRLIYNDTSSVILRIPIPGLSVLPNEKVQYEVATMQWLKKNTSIPVPSVLHWGTSEHNPLQLGPYILMEFIEHDMTLGDRLRDPVLTPNDRPRLNPNTSTQDLCFYYRQVAEIYLQLVRTPMPNIGSFIGTRGRSYKTWALTGRPLSMHWNELVRLGAFPRKMLPLGTFTTVSSYLISLAQLQLDHLINQPNDSITSESDCRQKFLSRMLFRKLAREDRLLTPVNGDGPFRLWCDDLRPDNILLDTNNKISGVIDWEFTYAAPADFAYSPPWWLLLEKPERWTDGLDAWAQTYERYFHLFLKMLRECEEEYIQLGTLNEDERLSRHMKQSWDTGTFWVVYAAMNNFAFDIIFRRKLDGMFFRCGSTWETDWESRIQFLSVEEQSELESLVVQKMKSSELAD
ncbi:hypothetical protein CBS11350_10014 [Aspergillus niger]|nr:hypothetical protein CBS11350_10014 [Aspergillus niger]